MKKLLAMILVAGMALSMIGALAESHTIALANINEKGIFGKLVKYGFQQACEERGWELIYVDNNADGQTAVSNAESLVLRSPEFVVDMNVDASVGQTIMDIFNAADIPVLAVDIALPGAPFFGVDSAAMGTFSGEWMAEYIKENWDGKVDYCIPITQIASGDEVNKRVRNCAVALADCGIEIGEVVEIEGENDAAVAQQRITDFLTAHPTSEKIVIFTINENTAQGAYAAAVTANREWDVRIMSAGATAQFVEPMYEDEGNQSWIATNAVAPELYGTQCCDLIERYFNGETLEGVYAAEMIVITWDNLAEYYPLDNLPWNNL